MIDAMEWNEQEPILLEDLIKIGEDDGFEIGFAKGLEQGFTKGLEQGFAKGLEQGFAKGLEQGFAKGLEQGIEQGRNALRASITAVLDVRGVALDDAHRARIGAEVDLDRLAQWMQRAAVATDARSVFE